MCGKGTKLYGKAGPSLKMPAIFIIGTDMQFEVLML